MQIRHVDIQNFRSIKDMSINFEEFTVILGSNNCGKSTILHAVNSFFTAAPRLNAKDFHNYKTDVAIIIRIEFSDFTPSEIDIFGTGIVNGRLRVVREFTISDLNPNYAVVSHVNPAFAEFRDETNGTKKRSIYTVLRRDFPDLDGCATVDEMSNALRSWEFAHPELCEDGRIKAFFGATNVAAGKLATKTAIHFIPAVREISQDAENMKSPAVALLADISRQAFENQKELVDLVSEFNEKLSKITDPKSIKSLGGLSESLTEKLQGIYLDSELIANLEAANRVEVSFPAPSIKVLRDELTLDVSQVGHGLQRAILFTIIQFLADRQAISTNDNIDGDYAGLGGFDHPQSDIIILIEEPELYQHPLKQKIIYEWFKQITIAFNRKTGIRIQIIVVSHSEKFLEMTEIDKIRLVRTGRSVEGERHHSIGFLSISEFNKSMASHWDNVTHPMQDEAFKAGLHIFELRVAEGFFADKVVLVEGISDKAILEGYAKRYAINLSSKGIAIISVDGKNKMPKPLYAFRHFGISTYAIYDNDQSERNSDPRLNRHLQRICGEEIIEDWPSAVKSTYAVFDGNLEKYLRQVCGDRYDDLRTRVAANFALKPSEIEKTPAAVSSFLLLAEEAGFRFEKIEEIIAHIAA